MENAKEPSYYTRMAGSLNRAKARRAAKSELRTGDNCRSEPGVKVPLVDRSRCEAKADCVEVCPYHVFEIGSIDEGEYRALGVFARLKVWAHGKKTAHTPRADDCRACGLCVAACPEKAITLVERQSG